MLLLQYSDPEGSKENMQGRAGFQKGGCDMVKDLMPLCLDHEASESSEQTVIEHLAECRECSKYYEALGKEMEPIEIQNDKENKEKEKRVKNMNQIL